MYANVRRYAVAVIQQESGAEDQLQIQRCLNNMLDIHCEFLSAIETTAEQFKVQKEHLQAFIESQFPAADREEFWSKCSLGY
jgi:phytoene/squalene synthetase